jgi:hypothetical protein
VVAYFDASALLKGHVDERGSCEAIEFAARAEVVATSLVSRAEVAAALAKAVRAKLLGANEARAAQRAFASQWPDIAKIPVTEALVSRAETPTDLPNCLDRRKVMLVGDDEPTVSSGRPFIRTYTCEHRNASRRRGSRMRALVPAEHAQGA